VERKSPSVGAMAKSGVILEPAREANPGESTTAFYEAHAREYFDRTVSADLSPLYDQFLQYVKPGARILDAGSGSGRDLKALHARGYDLVGVDSSPALAKIAAEFSGTTCLVMRLEDLTFERKFDAAWACASLLHIPKRKLLSVLRRLHMSLAQGGTLFVSVQQGEGEQHLPDGRYFSYYTSDEFAGFLCSAGFSVGQTWTSEDILHSRRGIRWLNFIAHRRDSTDAYRESQNALIKS
jgi:SAM-dependent methyltransferase